MIDSNEQVELNETTTVPTKAEHSIETDVTTPDIELLMFLAEWDEQEGEDWLDPEVFSQNTEFNQQLDKLKATSNEKDSDNH